MNGDKLIKYLGYSSNHPDMLAFLKQQDADLEMMHALNKPAAKPGKTMGIACRGVAYRHLGITLQFGMDFPELAEKQRRSDPEGLSIIQPADFRIKHPAGDGPLYLDHIIFSRPLPAPGATDKPLILPFGLQFMDNQNRHQRLFGHKNAHGDPRKPYYEEDESDYYYKDYKIIIYFERFDPEEKLLELAVSRTGSPIA
jgi:hypothetical protein